MPQFSPVSLVTERLMLRPLLESDVDAFFSIWSHAETMKYFSFPTMTSIDQAHERVSRILSASEKGENFFCTIEIRETGEVIGNCALFHGDAQCRRAEIGFCLNRNHWRKGYAEEAASAVIGHGFDAINLHRIEADIDPRNEASAKLLERLGFIREGLLRERWIVDGEVSNSALYGLLASDHRAQANARFQR